MKTTSILTTGIVLMLALAIAPVTGAAPSGVESGKLAYKFNYIALPDGASPSCGSGHRIFTHVGSTGHIEWTYDPTAALGITDCLTESIDHDWASVSIDQAGTYDVYVRLLGAPTSTMGICVSTLTDELGDHLCLLGTYNLTKSNSFTKIGGKLFADSLENMVWHIDVNANFRIAEVRLYH